MSTAPGRARHAPKTVNGITLWPIADLVPYARNARTHSPGQVEELARAIDAFGLAGVIVVRGGTIAKGHGTLAACQKIVAGGGRVHPVPGKAGGARPYPRGFLPVQDATGWDDATFRAFVVADNRLAERSGWDRELLAIELDAITAFDEDLVALTGFDLGNLEAEIAAALGTTAPAEPAAPAAKATTAPAPVESDPDPDREPDDDEADDPGDATAEPGNRADRPLVYQVIVDMDHPTKRLYLKRKRLYPNATAYFRAAIEREAMESENETGAEA